MEETVQLFLVERTENGHDQIPGHGHPGAKLIVDVDLKTVPVGEVGRLVAGQQLYIFSSTSIGVYHALGDLKIVLARLNIPHNGRFVFLFQQTAIARQGFPQISVHVR